MADAPIMVRMRHVRMAGICSSGARDWANSHGLSWNEFITNGLPIEMVEGTGDPFGLEVAEIAREEAANG